MCAITHSDTVFASVANEINGTGFTEEGRKVIVEVGKVAFPRDKGDGLPVIDGPCVNVPGMTGDGYS